MNFFPKNYWNVVVFACVMHWITVGRIYFKNYLKNVWKNCMSYPFVKNYNNSKGYLEESHVEMIEEILEMFLIDFLEIFLKKFIEQFLWKPWMNYKAGRNICIGTPGKILPYKEKKKKEDNIRKVKNNLIYFLSLSDLKFHRL